LSTREFFRGHNSCAQTQFPVTLAYIMQLQPIRHRE
jgi:hypothetical protein